MLYFRPNEVKIIQIDALSKTIGHYLQKYRGVTEITKIPLAPLYCLGTWHSEGTTDVVLQASLAASATKLDAIISLVAEDKVKELTLNIPLYNAHLKPGITFKPSFQTSLAFSWMDLVVKTNEGEILLPDGGEEKVKWVSETKILKDERDQEEQRRQRNVQGNGQGNGRGNGGGNEGPKQEPEEGAGGGVPRDDEFHGQLETVPHDNQYMERNYGARPRQTGYHDNRPHNSTRQVVRNNRYSSTEEDYDKESGQKSLLKLVSNTMPNIPQSGSSASPHHTMAASANTVASQPKVSGTTSQSASFHQSSVTVHLPRQVRKTKKRLNQENQVKLFLRIIDQMKANDKKAALDDFEALVTESENGENGDDEGDDGESSGWEDDDNVSLSTLKIDDIDTGKD